MKYYESPNDFSGKKVDNPLDLLQIIVTYLIVAPIRICMEFSRKIIYTGEYLPVYLFNCLKLSTVILSSGVIYRLFIKKTLTLYGTFLPITVQIIVFICFFLLWFFLRLFYVEYDYRKPREEVSDYEKKAVMGDDSKLNEVFMNTVNEAYEIEGELLDDTFSPQNEQQREFLDKVEERQNLTSPEATTAQLYNNILEHENRVVNDFLGPKGLEPDDDPIMDLMKGLSPMTPEVTKASNSVLNVLRKGTVEDTVNDSNLSLGYNTAGSMFTDNDYFDDDY